MRAVTAAAQEIRESGLLGGTHNRNRASFFGKMMLEEAGQFVFKHLDHHLRQFGV